MSCIEIRVRFCWPARSFKLPMPNFVPSIGKFNRETSGGCGAVVIIWHEWHRYAFFDWCQRMDSVAWQRAQVCACACVRGDCADDDCAGDICASICDAFKFVGSALSSASLLPAACISANTSCIKIPPWGWSVPDFSSAQNA